MSLHATCISIDNQGILLLGPSASGKSDLALRLIDQGAQLVADDQVQLAIAEIPSPVGGSTYTSRSRGHSGEDRTLLRPLPNLPPIGGEAQQLIASPPECLRGLLEVRGIGILRLPYVEAIPVTLAIQLVPRAAVERLPEPAFFDCLGLRLPLYSLHAFDASTPAKIRALLHHPAG